MNQKIYLKNIEILKKITKIFSIRTGKPETFHFTTYGTKTETSESSNV